MASKPQQSTMNPLDSPSSRPQPSAANIVAAAVSPFDYPDALDERFEKLIDSIKPIQSAECTRSNIYAYTRKLVAKAHSSALVFCFGSFPLKTYLPDGDIDVGVYIPPKAISSFFMRLKKLLIAEQNNQSSPLPVRFVTFINAEVPLVKVFVSNVLVDISANTTAALGTVCFFEEIDRYIGRQHLFKRSVLAIKAWSMYESRILASHQSLLSSYALETLVLYIISAFHTVISKPLHVLALFLRFYSCFDWEQYGISVSGPFRLSSLQSSSPSSPNLSLLQSLVDPSTAVPTLSLAGLTQPAPGASARTTNSDTPRSGDELPSVSRPDSPDDPYAASRHMLISPEFLQACRLKYGLSSEESAALNPRRRKHRHFTNGVEEDEFDFAEEAPRPRHFATKYLNIVDPLDELNNLGKSVNYSNFLRIRHCLTRGCQMLDSLLETGRDINVSARKARRQQAAASPIHSVRQPSPASPPEVSLPDAIASEPVPIITPSQSVTEAVSSSPDAPTTPSSESVDRSLPSPAVGAVLAQSHGTALVEVTAENIAASVPLTVPESIENEVDADSSDDEDGPGHSSPSILASVASSTLDVPSAAEVPETDDPSQSPHLARTTTPTRAQVLSTASSSPATKSSATVSDADTGHCDIAMSEVSSVAHSTETEAPADASSVSSLPTAGSQGAYSNFQASTKWAKINRRIRRRSHSQRPAVETGEQKLKEVLDQLGSIFKHTNLRYANADPTPTICPCCPCVSRVVPSAAASAAAATAAAAAGGSSADEKDSVSSTTASTITPTTSATPIQLSSPALSAYSLPEMGTPAHGGGGASAAADRSVPSAVSSLVSEYAGQPVTLHLPASLRNPAPSTADRTETVTNLFGNRRPDVTFELLHLPSLISADSISRSGYSCACPAPAPGEKSGSSCICDCDCHVSSSANKRAESWQTDLERLWPQFQHIKGAAMMQSMFAQQQQQAQNQYYNNSHNSGYGHDGGRNNQHRNSYQNNNPYNPGSNHQHPRQRHSGSNSNSSSYNNNNNNNNESSRNNNNNSNNSRRSDKSNNWRGRGDPNAPSNTTNSNANANSAPTPTNSAASQNRPRTSTPVHNSNSPRAQEEPVNASSDSRQRSKVQSNTEQNRRHTAAAPTATVAPSEPISKSSLDVLASTEYAPPQNSRPVLPPASSGSGGPSRGPSLARSRQRNSNPANGNNATNAGNNNTGSASVASNSQASVAATSSLSTFATESAVLVTTLPVSVGLTPTVPIGLSPDSASAFTAATPLRTAVNSTAATIASLLADSNRSEPAAPLPRVVPLVLPAASSVSSHSPRSQAPRSGRSSHSLDLLPVSSTASFSVSPLESPRTPSTATISSVNSPNLSASPAPIEPASTSISSSPASAAGHSSGPKPNIWRASNLVAKLAQSPARAAPSPSHPSSASAPAPANLKKQPAPGPAAGPAARPSAAKGPQPPKPAPPSSAASVPTPTAAAAASTSSSVGTASPRPLSAAAPSWQPVKPVAQTGGSSDPSLSAPLPNPGPAPPGRSIWNLKSEERKRLPPRPPVASPVNPAPSPQNPPPKAPEAPAPAPPHRPEPPQFAPNPRVGGQPFAPQAVVGAGSDSDSDGDDADGDFDTVQLRRKRNKRPVAANPGRDKPQARRDKREAVAATGDRPKERPAGGPPRPPSRTDAPSWRSNKQ